MKILMWDNGLNTELAISIARAGHAVAYCTPWTEAFPKPLKSYIGRGLEGLETPDSFSMALDKCDAVVCPDTFSMDRVHQARAAGKPVWGAGHAEKMELDRAWMKTAQKAMGLPVGPYVKKLGIEELMKYLRTVKDVWVKTSKFRQYETFKHKDWESTRNQHLGAILDAYGPAADEMEFIIEDPLKGIEVGLDRLFANGDWLLPAGWGYEAKDQAYIGTHGDLPPVLADACRRMTKTLASFNCNSFVSNEMIMDKSGVGYMIEPTIRCPHPPTAGMLVMYENLPDVILGKATKLKPNFKYCAVLVLRSSWAGDHPLEVEIKPDAREYIKLSQACRVKGKYYSVSGNEFIGFVVGYGPSLREAVNCCKSYLPAVKCKELDADEAALDKLVEETVTEGRKVGINF